MKVSRAEWLLRHDRCATLRSTATPANTGVWQTLVSAVCPSEVLRLLHVLSELGVLPGQPCSRAPLILVPRRAAGYRLAASSPFRSRAARRSHSLPTQPPAIFSAPAGATCAALTNQAVRPDSPGAQAASGFPPPPQQGALCCRRPPSGSSAPV